MNCREQHAMTVCKTCTKLNFTFHLGQKIKIQNNICLTQFGMYKMMFVPEIMYQPLIWCIYYKTCKVYPAFIYLFICKYFSLE